MIAYSFVQICAGSVLKDKNAGWVVSNDPNKKVYQLDKHGLFDTRIFVKNKLYNILEFVQKILTVE